MCSSDLTARLRLDDNWMGAPNYHLIAVLHRLVLHDVANLNLILVD